MNIAKFAKSSFETVFIPGGLSASFFIMTSVCSKEELVPPLRELYSSQNIFCSPNAL